MSRDATPASMKIAGTAILWNQLVAAIFKRGYETPKLMRVLVPFAHQGSWHASHASWFPAAVFRERATKLPNAGG